MLKNDLSFFGKKWENREIFQKNINQQSDQQHCICHIYENIERNLLDGFCLTRWKIDLSVFDHRIAQFILMSAERRKRDFLKFFA